MVDRIWTSPDLSPPPEDVLSAPPDGCHQIKLFEVLPQFLSGDPHSDRVRVRYFSLPTKTILWANAWFGQGAEGPPGHAHGGSIAATLDEAMGGIAWLQGRRCLALEITVKFRKALPLGTLVQIQSHVEKFDGRKIYSCAQMKGPGGELFAESTGLFLELEHQAAERLLQRLKLVDESF